ncbi:MAG: hypothetical protein FWC91_13885 [Defluviitaleaceae bacterium]|nr:hypothetical protein [Defluviitaleaceae bacterium]
MEYAVMLLIFILLFILIYKILSLINSKSSEKLALFVSAFTVVGVIATFTDVFRIPLYSFLSERLPEFGELLEIIPSWVQVVIVFIVIIVIGSVYEKITSPQSKDTDDITPNLGKTNTVEPKKSAKSEGTINFSKMKKIELVSMLNDIENILYQDRNIIKDEDSVR